VPVWRAVRGCGIEDDAAARCDHDALERREVGDDVALALAKRALAFFSKM
jgi:hypothetical protein